MAQNPTWLINKYPHDLKAQIRELVSQGYSVTMQTEKTASLARPKHFSCLIAALLLVTGIGWIFYVFYYLAKKDDSVYLDLDTQV